ncbi:type IV pilin protein [Aeromonas veronii]|uniref:type IV pilin protein n=1 Tax=Aeromonas veronii TaxID=654 RepID=UPI003F78E8B5
MNAANRQETYFMDFNQYASSAAALGISSASENGLYQLSIAVSGNTYTLSASAGDDSPSQRYRLHSVFH